ncbi:MAG: hypothetical protein E5299_01502 [Burkholderia gladioli]|nr:MAG: hypothetical protein E5299_01502 [Burkholderia gladioli]
MKTFDVLDLLCLGMAYLIPSQRIEAWLTFSVLALICFIVAFAMAFWEANAEDVL